MRSMNVVFDFFANVLDGPLYYIVVIVSLIVIMAIIGFLMERNRIKQEKELVQRLEEIPVGKPTIPVSNTNLENPLQAKPSEVIDFTATNTSEKDALKASQTIDFTDSSQNSSHDVI